MKKGLLLIIFIFFTCLLSANTVLVDINGSGDYTSIQAGINNATNGDSVLVYPGTYYENIDFLGKNIKVGSLYLTTGIDSFIRNTIIDGNQEGSVVKIFNNNYDSTLLCGFIIQNGSGSFSPLTDLCKTGGGINIYESKPTISSCIIKLNSAYAGGGICITGDLTPFTKRCKIIKNHAYNAGGGIFSWHINFSSEDLCDIYMNTAASGCDIKSTSHIEAYLDTFTAYDPDNFYFLAPESSIFQCENAKIQPVNNDLYVSPDGNNNNSGLTPDDPLKNIYMALIKIDSDSTHPNTIHLSSGRYSPLATGEKFPLNLRSYISIIGDKSENTILDADSLSRICLGKNYEEVFSIEKVRFTNSCPIYLSGGALKLYQPRGLILKNIIFTNNYDEHQSAISVLSLGDEILDSTSIYMENVLIENNHQWAAGLEAKELVLKNVVVKNNLPDYSADFPNGGGLFLFAISNPDDYNFYLYNVEITENVNVDNEWAHMPSALSVYEANLNLVNCTIGNNTATYDGEAFKIDEGANVNIYNSILYGDTPREILVDGTYGSCELNIYNSLVQGGLWDIGTIGSNTVSWDGNNNLPADADPLWTETGEFPYQLSAGSPCINAGTLDLPPEFELPDYDLAGNPRIQGDSIDIGAYEYHPEAVGGNNNNLEQELYLFQNYPNPFKQSTEISFLTSDIIGVKDYTLSIYNAKGQLIRRYKGWEEGFEAKTTVNWDSKDSHGREVAPGTYFYKLEYNNNAVVRKMVKVK